MARESGIVDGLFVFRLCFCFVGWLVGRLVVSLVVWVIGWFGAWSVG